MSGFHSKASVRLLALTGLPGSVAGRAQATDFWVSAMRAPQASKRARSRGPLKDSEASVWIFVDPPMGFDGVALAPFVRGSAAQAPHKRTALSLETTRSAFTSKTLSRWPTNAMKAEPSSPDVTAKRALCSPI